MDPQSLSSIETAKQALLDLPDEVFNDLVFVLPSVISESIKGDPDGAPMKGSEEDELSRSYIQKECWRKLNDNPQVNTAIRGQAGRIVGLGFEPTSEIFEIQSAMEDIEQDPRNRLYHYWPQYLSRFFGEGELALICTLHSDGFVEIDFLDPDRIGPKGDEGTGVLYHPDKPYFPLFFNVQNKDGQHVEQVPSINIARYPDLIEVAKKHNDWDGSKQRKKFAWGKFKALKGYYRFIVYWDRGFVQRRATSYIRTVLQWVNFYEDLKRYEIDHKKSAGAYVWAITFEDSKAFKKWLKMTDAEREKTGLYAKIVPGSRLFLPPGMKLTATNPNLPNISDSDTDILHMITSGLNESVDTAMGSLNSTFASAKAAKGPMSDRTADEVAYFDRFYRYDFWGSVFFLMSKVSGFPERFEVDEAVRFGLGGQPIFEKVSRRPEQLIDVNYPTSESIDLESRVKALLGSKHGPLPESIGLPASDAASRMGIGGYGRRRLRKATEDKKYPKLVYSIDSNAAESKQEKAEGGEKPKEKEKEK